MQSAKRDVLDTTRNAQRTTREINLANKAAFFFFSFIYKNIYQFLEHKAPIFHISNGMLHAQREKR
jgi:hypothetical protein